MWIKMMRTDECGLDVGGFVFVFHIVESRQNCFFQCLFVIGYKNVINALLFLLESSASVFTLRVAESILHGLFQFCVFNVLNLFSPFCLFVKCIRYTCLH